MTATLLDGKMLAKSCREQLKQKINDMGINPCLAVILASADEASKVYVKAKEKACDDVGIKTETFVFDENVQNDDILALIEKLNEDNDVNGILVQLPVFGHLDEKAILNRVASIKDVDGFHVYNAGLLFMGDKNAIVCCTPKGVMRLVHQAKKDISGLEAVVVGRSQIVGKPLAQLLLSENATVTMAHSRTKNLKEVCRRADILVTAIGKPEFFTEEFIKDGAMVIDVGINRTKEGIKGDVKFDDALKKAQYLTPVPGGVGPMTIAMLMENTYEAYLKQHGS